MKRRSLGLAGLLVVAVLVAGATKAELSAAQRSELRKECNTGLQDSFAPTREEKAAIRTCVEWNHPCRR